MDGHHAPQRDHTDNHYADDEARALREFLRKRLTEDLARLWDRAHGESPRRPGLAAQLSALDSILVRLERGEPPARWEVRLLLYGYGHHPDYDPAWVRILEN